MALTFPLPWRWANPLPHGNNIIDIAGSNQLWVQVAERGQLYTSDNLVLWTPRETHTTRALRAVTFFKDRILAVGESGTIVTGPRAGDLRMTALGTDDWLEGVASSPLLAAAVGDNGAVYTSGDGDSWQRQPVPFTDWIRSIAYGQPGGVGTFLAVGEAGFVATSTDGAHWQVGLPFASTDLNRVAWYNGEFWALGDAGAIFSSSSGTNWIKAPIGASGALNAFAGADSARLVGGDAEVWMRRGRSVWTDELSPLTSFPPPVATFLSATATTNLFLLCGETGVIAEGVLATNETVWFTLTDSLRNWLWDVKRFPRLYLTAGDRATILSSLDGIDWEPELPPDSATNAVFLGVGGKTNLAVVVGSGGTIITSVDRLETVVTTNSSGALVTNQVSTLGIYWDAVSPRPTTADLQGITVFGDQFVVAGGSGTVLTSPDATVWTRRSTPTTAFLSSVEAFPGGLVAVGRQGTILTSPDAVNWTARSFPSTNWIYRVRYLGGQLIAVGQNGTILTSLDGSTWCAQQSGTTHWLNDIGFIDGTYLVVGNQGTVLTSTDALTWTDRRTITGKSLFGVAQDSGMLVTVGVEGVILRTEFAAAPSGVGFLRYPARAEDNLFLFSGRAGQRFSLDRSSDLTSWILGPVLQLDNSGRLLYLDPQSNLPDRQFFRTMPVP